MTPSRRPLENQAALVTGAAKRIGRAIALALAEAGANVAITWRDSEAAARETIAEIEACGVQAAAIRADVRVPSEIRAAVEAAAARFSRLDLLVNNAGRYETAVLQDITVEQWDAMFETNTRGPFLAAQAAYPYLKTVRGRIINI